MIEQELGKQLEAVIKQRDKAEAELAEFKRWLDEESTFLSKDDAMAILLERAEKAEAERDAAVRRAEEIGEDARRMTDEIEKLSVALEQVEWAYDGYQWKCLWCTAYRTDGHKPDCARQSALSPEETHWEPKDGWPAGEDAKRACEEYVDAE